jgi:hypothetical protein
MAARRRPARFVIGEIMTNKSPTKQNDSAVSVADAEAALARLEQERAGLLERHERHADERRRVSFDAFNGDAKAGKLLDGLHEEAVRFQSRLASIDDALNEGRRRLAAAREHEARAADQQRALAARDAAEKFWQHGTGIDGALELLSEHINGKYAAQLVMRQNGVHHPSVEQLDAVIYRRIVGVMFDTPLRQRFEVLPPNERARTVTAADGSFKSMVDRNLLPRLGEDAQTKTNPEAA